MRDTTESIRNITLTAMFAALTFLATMFLKLPIPLTNSGYVHIGDAIIFIAASILSPGYAALSAAIGASLADITVGASVWAPYTIVIKAVMALLFTYKAEKILVKRNIVMAFVAGVVNMVGYYFAEVLISKSFIVPLASIPMGLFQFFGSIIFFMVLAVALDRTNIKKLVK